MTTPQVEKNMIRSELAGYIQELSCEKMKAYNANHTLSSTDIKVSIDNDNPHQDTTRYVAVIHITENLYKNIEVKREIETVRESIKNKCNDNIKNRRWTLSQYNVRISDVLLRKNGEENKVDPTVGINITGPDVQSKTTKNFSLFTSHSTQDIEFVRNLKKLLLPYGIECFLAHEDIKPSMEWRRQLKRQIRNTDAFCAILTDRFRESDWCDQEAGMAIARNKAIVLIMIDQTSNSPHGFLEETQAIYIADQKNINKNLIKILVGISKNKKCWNLFLDIYTDRIQNAKTQVEAKRHYSMLRRLCKNKIISKKYIERLHNNFSSNEKLMKCKTDYNRIFEQYDLPKIN